MLLVFKPIDWLMKFEENTHSVEILEFSVNLREISFENFKVLK